MTVLLTENSPLMPAPLLLVPSWFMPKFVSGVSVFWSVLFLFLLSFVVLHAWYTKISVPSLRLAWPRGLRHPIVGYCIVYPILIQYDGIWCC